MIWEVEAGRGCARLFIPPPRLIIPNLNKREEDEGRETFLLAMLPGAGLLGEQEAFLGGC